MRVERELLERCKDIINNGCGEWELVCISNEIEEELAKPEKNLITLDQIDNLKRLFFDLTFEQGIRFAEKYHGITK